nr:MAG TPA: Xaa-Pro dipeptidase [Caudoviricetes sp.]
MVTLSCCFRVFIHRLRTLSPILIAHYHWR